MELQVRLGEEEGLLSIAVSSLPAGRLPLLLSSLVESVISFVAVAGVNKLGSLARIAICFAVARSRFLSINGIPHPHFVHFRSICC